MFKNLNYCISLQILIFLSPSKTPAPTSSPSSHHTMISPKSMCAAVGGNTNSFNFEETPIFSRLVKMTKGSAPGVVCVGKVYIQQHGWGMLAAKGLDARLKRQISQYCKRVFKGWLGRSNENPTRHALFTQAYVGARTDEAHGQQLTDKAAAKALGIPSREDFCDVLSTRLEVHFPLREDRDDMQKALDTFQEALDTVLQSFPFAHRTQKVHTLIGRHGEDWRQMRLSAHTACFTYGGEQKNINALYAATQYKNKQDGIYVEVAGPLLKRMQRRDKVKSRCKLSIERSGDRGFCFAFSDEWTRGERIAYQNKFRALLLHMYPNSRRPTTPSTRGPRRSASATRRARRWRT